MSLQHICNVLLRSDLTDSVPAVSQVLSASLPLSDLTGNRMEQPGVWTVLGLSVPGSVWLELLCIQSLSSSCHLAHPVFLAEPFSNVRKTFVFRTPAKISIESRP